ncbi:LINE-1 retrotransposable element ORF2 protein [Bienertia sinuspersici]
MELNKNDIQKIPIWVKLDLHFKYWGQKCLERIIQPVGNLLKVDSMTAKRDKLQYARCMIEVKMGQVFPEQVKFKNEKNEIITESKNKQVKVWQQKKVNPQDQENNNHVSKEGQEKEYRQREIGRSNIVATNQEKSANQDMICSTKVDMEERIGNIVRQREMESMRNCIATCNIQDIPYSGHFYTWSNKQMADDRVWSELDRIMANDEWLEAYKHANAIFLTEGCSDHCPGLVRMNFEVGMGRKPFKYFRMWQLAPDYTERIKHAWGEELRGTVMYKIVQKLKRVKASMKELNKQGFNNMQAEDSKRYQEMVGIQEKLHRDPLNAALMEEEKEATHQYHLAHKKYIQYLKQKAKAIKDRSGQLKDSLEGIQSAFVDYYSDLLGWKLGDRDAVKTDIVNRGPVLTEEQKKRMTLPFSRREVKEAIFSIHGDKSPGLDGFGTHFYKHNWELIGEEVTTAILDFFNSGKLLKEINNTFLVLIPKVSKPQDVSEFRPIACCNTIYKGITKLLCLRLKEVLPDLISENQGAFVHGRYIVDNIMVCQDLVRRYGRKNNTPSCMIKLDLRKAYDTVDWNFIEEMLQELNFPKAFIEWVMECISTPSFSLVLNGSSYGHFKSCRGLRQGDPLSPLLFVLGMEYLSRTLNRLNEDPEFKLHPRCKGIQLTHMCFADDLIMCCRGEKKSVDRILQAFNVLSNTSGLQANNSKTELFTSGMKEEEVQQIIAESGFKRGKLPFKYLGVPISSKRVNASQCEVLIEKMTARIRTWSSRHISFAGRSQLINSVLMSIQQYWAQVFVLPVSVLHSIEQICRSYLWSGQWHLNKPGYISWENVCRPKKEGGMGFKNIHQWNSANMGRYVWAIETKQDSLWLKWVNSVYLRDQEWWNYEPPVDASWYWKRIYATKEKIKEVSSQNEIQGIKRYKVSTVYHKLIDHRPPYPWVENVWSRFNIPKYRFCTWIAVQGRLPSADRMVKMGSQMEKTCPLCSHDEESIHHLFFECSYSQDILNDIKQWLGITIQSNQLLNILKWIRRKRRSMEMQKSVWNSAITAAVFYIWKARNEERHGKKKLKCQQVVKQIKQNVKSKIRMKDRQKSNPMQLVWLDNL